MSCVEHQVARVDKIDKSICESECIYMGPEIGIHDKLVPSLLTGTLVFSQHVSLALHPLLEDEHECLFGMVNARIDASGRNVHTMVFIDVNSL